MNIPGHIIGFVVRLLAKMLGRDPAGFLSPSPSYRWIASGDLRWPGTRTLSQGTGWLLGSLISAVILLHLSLIRRKAPA
jgi:hypothetical protein